MRMHCAAHTGAVPVAWLFLAVTSPVWAARPFVTDDARVVDPGACQAEVWTQQGPEGDQYWVLPACNPTGWLEVTAGTGVLSDDEGDWSPVVQVQGKTLLRPLTPGGIGWGVAVGAVVNAGKLAEDEQLGSVYGYVPVSLATARERLVVHANLGARYDAAPAETRLIWGLAGELELQSRLYAVAEVYGGNTTETFAQMGVRLWAVTARLQIDATYGRQLGVGREQEWFTVGFRALSAPCVFLGSGE